MKRLYVLVRYDLNYSSPAVQAGHAVANFCLNCKDVKEWNNHTLIYLGVNDKWKLKRWRFKLKRDNIEYHEFREPDMNNEVTAIAVMLDNDLYFKKLDLLK